MAAKLVPLLVLISIIITAFGNENMRVAAEAGSWCVARSDASEQALQTALDYACGAGADCIPLQSDGLCFLPNSIEAHASFAFNSFYQRKARAPGSCDFSGTATIAQTDPSYGSCVYPSSASTAGGTNAPMTRPAMNNSNVPTNTPTYSSGVAGQTPGMNPTLPGDSSSTSEAYISTSTSVFFSFLLIMSLRFRPM